MTGNWILQFFLLCLQASPFHPVESFYAVVFISTFCCAVICCHIALLFVLLLTSPHGCIHLFSDYESLPFPHPECAGESARITSSGSAAALKSIKEHFSLGATIISD